MHAHRELAHRSGGDWTWRTALHEEKLTPPSRGRRGLQARQGERGYYTPEQYQENQV
jgi:hypothetical protein